MNENYSINQNMNKTKKSLLFTYLLPRGSFQGHGKIEIPPEAQPGVVPSIYTGHPSYAYPADRSYDEDRGYPGNSSLGQSLPGDYPKGAPPLGYHSGAPNPTGFLQLES